MRRDGSGWNLQTTGGSVRASTVILATNAYTNRFMPNVPIRPVRGQVAATGALNRVVVPIPMGANSGYQYWRQTAEGRLVAGGWRDLDPEAEVGTEEILNQRIQSALDEFCAAVAGPNSVIEHRWAGIMGFTPDMLPLVGPVPGTEGLYMAAGYSGHGVAMALLCGWRLALLAVGEDAHVPACFNPARWLTGVAV
jgi:glycine/D-amino acid oxidase-like deaminating enzyme